jgi:hypothetical protein
MKTRPLSHPAFAARLFLSLLVLFAGLGFFVLASNAAGSFRRLLDGVLGGMPGAAGFLPFVLGVICVIYGCVGLLFGREQS